MNSERRAELPAMSIQPHFLAVIQGRDEKTLHGPCKPTIRLLPESDIILQGQKQLGTKETMIEGDRRLTGGYPSYFAYRC